LKWTDALSWHDGDGSKPPSPLLVIEMTKFAGSWQDRQLLKELLDQLDRLNEKIPQEQWPLDQNGQQEPPWKLFVGIKFIDPATGKGFRYEHSTWGARRMLDELFECVFNTQILRGNNCIPLVNPNEKPWKVGTGLRKRPVLEILSFKTIGGDRETMPAKPPVPQLTGPNAAPVEPSASSAPTQPAPAQSQPAKPKPAINLAAKTLDAWATSSR
jgi:hypothetical protein